jgi:hypothetical protein
MQKDKVYEAEEFELSLKAYLSYVSRKMKKDDQYSPHPLVKALVNAIEGAVEKGKPGRYAGLSGVADKYEDGEARKLFLCAVEMHRDRTMTILEIEDVTLRKPVPIKVASYILLLSIKFDKFEGDYIKVEDSIRIINETIPQLNLIRFNNEEWKEARDFLAKNLDLFKLPHKMFEEYRKDFMSIKESTLWEEFPPRVRAIVASTWMQEKHPELYKDGAINTVNVYLSDEYLKTEVLNNTMQLLYGAPSEVFNDLYQWNLFKDLHLTEDETITRTKIRRNDPCLCGSGKKYKKCCAK